jgi:hypothetical protein
MLLVKQRDIMIALTGRLNERDEQLLQLQEELEAYDSHQKCACWLLTCSLVTVPNIWATWVVMMRFWSHAGCIRPCIAIAMLSPSQEDRLDYAAPHRGWTLS